MNIILATQGSQGVIALSELFAENYKPQDIHVAICEDGVSGPLIEFIRYNQISYSSHASGFHFSKWLINEKKKYDQLVSISWKYLFRKDVLKYFRGNAINFHPGILPNYRGCFSTPWSMINNEGYVGYTYHYISERFDEGDILFESKIKIANIDTAHSLNYRIFQRGLSNLTEAIKLIGVKGAPQSGLVNYYPNKLPLSGEIDNKWSVKQKNTFMKAIFFPPHESNLNLINDEGE